MAPDRAPAPDRLRSPAAELTDGVVWLRPPRAADAPAVARAGDDPEVARWTPFPSPFTTEDARDWLAAQQEAGTVDLIVTDRADGTRVLGWVGLHDLDLSQRRAELGIWLAAGARGRGIGRRAMALLTAWGFDELGLVRIAALCLSGNARGRRAMEAAGFVPEGVLRAYEDVKGVRYDTAILGMVRSDPRG
ncbi:GNAT family N-acetyltransferase [Streptomyces sp. OfavH-34-F]|uniref:GNAT family N-acetyltransferase n=1 Tax=Streptomyces sp. OfavH-34-F TaxID=2917760 RepID=UPI001EF2DFD2|nr:GNAT family protein [Streptomyces sp. OfavH-34-F]MCG7528205.1 GNAT family N-acetyltransferase [Streptomyces sp. OfavH-34-F]